MYLAQNIKALRTKANETQKDLAQFLAVSEMTISRYESGDNEPDLSKLVVIAEHFDVTVDDLLLTKLEEPVKLYIKNIKYLRRQNEMTQSAMADLLGFKGKSSLCAIETGKVGMSIENLTKLADYFGVTLDQLVNKNLSDGGV